MNSLSVQNTQKVSYDFVLDNLSCCYSRITKCLQSLPLVTVANKLNLYAFSTISPTIIRIALPDYVT